MEMKKEHANWIVVLVIALVYLAVMGNIQGFKALLPLVQDEFGITRAEAGLYSSFYFLSATILAIFSGRVVDKIGAPKGLTLGVTMVGLTILLHSAAPLFAYILILAFLTGISFSLLTPSVTKAVIEQVEPERKSFFMGIAHGGAGMGAFLGASFLPLVAASFGWRNSLLVGGFLALVIGLLAFLFFSRSSLSKSTTANKASSEFPEKNHSSLKNDLLYLLKNRYLLSVCFMGIVFGMSISSITGHFSLYITRDLGFSPELAGLGLGIAHLGGIAGQPSWGVLTDKLFQGDRRKGLSLVGGFIAALCLIFGLLISQFPTPAYLLLPASFLLGFCVMGAMALYFTTVSELVSLEYVGVATGIALIFTRTGVVLAPPVFGLAADITDNYTLSWILLGTVVLLLSMIFIYFSGKFKNKSKTTFTTEENNKNFSSGSQ